MRHTLTAAVLVLAASAAQAQRLEPWIEGLNRPCDITALPGDDDTFYVVEQPGHVRLIKDGKLLDEPVFAIEDDFTSFQSNWERGLLGIALAPDFATSRTVYLNYTDGKGATIVARYTASDDLHIDRASEERLLRIHQPYGNHNCGALRFGPDGMLWVGTGDGGAANDPHGNGQRTDTLLGKMLRIDVTGEPDEGLAYAIPDDNPFIDDEDARDEIWAIGLRNPWRYEFDSKGRLWIADVGQNRFEEVHIQPEGSTGGENYGWNEMEGDGPFRAGRRRADDPKPVPPSAHRERGFEPPVYSYRHHPTGSITGGYFYEGAGVPALQNRYICADFMSGRVWSFAIDEDNRADDIVEHSRDWTSAFGEAGPAFAISSFGRTNDGELLVLDHKSGRIFRVVK